MAILVSKRMGGSVNQGNGGRLERSCGPSPGDWLRAAPGQPGIERIEAYFVGHAYDPHRHDTYAVGFTMAGVQCFDYRGEVVCSTPGHAIALHPDEVHNGRAGAAGGFRYRMLYVEPQLIQSALGDRTALPFVRSAVSTDARLLAALQSALDDLESTLEPLATDQAVLALAEALLALDPSAGTRRLPAPCGRAVDRARAFLDAHFDRVVSAAELEAASGLDRYVLARQFRARLGTSPYRYLLMRRLDRARSLLRSGQALADTAAASGFADQSHMTRLFKRAYGLPPGRWRAMHRSAGEP